MAQNFEIEFSNGWNIFTNQIKSKIRNFAHKKIHVNVKLTISWELNFAYKQNSSFRARLSFAEEGPPNRELRVIKFP